MHDEASGMPHKTHRPALVEELVSVLVWPVGLVVWFVVAGVIGSSAVVAFLPASVIGWGILCLGAFARSDPIGFASIVGPPLAIATAVFAAEVVGGDPAIQLALFPSVWLLVWTIAGSRLWPGWSRIVLRRHRPGSPEVQLHSAWREISRLWRSWSTPEQGQAIWAGIVALQRWETPRTRPVIDGLFAYWELTTVPGADPARIDRLLRRSGEEWARMWEPPRLRLPRRGADPFDRPTRGTRLEYLYPRIEALLAVATPEQRRRIAVESARLAIRDAGIANPALETVLDGAVEGASDPKAQRDVEERLRALREARDAPGGADIDVIAWNRLAHEVVALSAALEALATDLSPVAAAGVVSESIRSESDGQRALAYEGLAADIVGPDVAKAAIVIEPACDPAPGPRESDASILGQQSQTGVGLLRLGIVGLAAGVAGTVIEHSTWFFYADLSSAYAIDHVAGLVLMYLIGIGLLRPLGRAAFWDEAFIFIASFVSVELMTALVDTMSSAAASAGPTWFQFLDDPDLLVAYPLLRGLVFGALLVAGSLLLSPRQRLEPARAEDPG